MREATDKIISTDLMSSLKIEVIDLDAHPMACSCASAPAWGACARRSKTLEAAIARTPALTIDGRRMKEMTL